MKKAYSIFPKGTTNTDVFDMLMEGIMICVCYNCECIHSIEQTPETLNSFKCIKCKHVQDLATMNPKYMNIHTGVLEK